MLSWFGKQKLTEKEWQTIVDTWLGSYRPATQKRYMYVVEAFKRSQHGIAFDQIKDIHARRFRQEYAAREGHHGGRCSDVTIRNAMGVMRKFYEYLRANQIVTRNPFDGVMQELVGAQPGEKRPTKLIPFEYVTRLFELLHKEVKENRNAVTVSLLAFFTCLFGGALRIGELCRLNLKDVRRTREGTLYLVLEETKAGHQQKQPFSDQFAPAIEAQAALRRAEGAGDDDPLFVRYTFDGKAERLTWKACDAMFTRWLKRAGLEGRYSCHSARATAITKMLTDMHELGITYREVQEFSRHSSVQMVEWYDKRRFEIDESPARKMKW